MTRVMYDCIGAEASWVKANLPAPSLMAWYGTGSSGIPWTSAERALFPASSLVEIDQGGAGTPVATATVRDVESGAWGPGQAVNRAGWTAERPTIYCNRSTLPTVLADGWKGDIWLAWPGWRGEALPSAPGCTYVAVQDQFNSNYDHNTVLDTAWPHKAAVTAPLTLTSDIRDIGLTWGPVAGADHYIIEYNGVAIDRPPANSNPLMVVSKLPIPGTHGGTITVFAIVHSKPVQVGVISLP